MNIRQLFKAEAGLEYLSDAQDVPVSEIIDALIGVCFSEEEAGAIKRHISDEADV